MNPNHFSRILRITAVLACWGAVASTAFSAEPTADPTTRFQREQERWRDVRGFNYQPSFGRTAVEIWIDKFDAAAVDRELGLGRKYFPQINTVRLWLSHDPFLKNPALFTRNFEAVLQSCQKHRLRAIPTLFNDWHSIPDFGGVSREMIGYWFSSYGKRGQASNYVFRPFLEAMFKAHAEDARILAWDLCNEPFNNGGEVYLEWLRHTYQTAKALGATQPIGVSVAASLGQLKPVEPFSDVLMIHPYFASKVPWEPLTAFAREHGKALLATECCWGALNDASRAAIIQSDCGALVQQQVGFLAHALHESLVGDLHRPQFSPLRVASSASYMAFINMDGSLRPGHDVFNRYCQGISPAGSDARTEVGRDKGAAVPDNASPRVLRDDGTYQNGGYWATPLPWLMETLMRADPARAAAAFCDAVEDFQARKDINEWVNDNAPKKRGVRDYCASAAMPLAGAKRLRAFLAASGKQLSPELAKKFDAAETWLREQAKRVLRGSSRVGKGGVRIFTPDATGGYGAFWVRDWSYAIEGCPEAFTREEIRDGYLFLAAAQREDGCMPDRVRADGKGVYSPGGEAKPFSRNGSVDQSPFMVILCHQYWKPHGNLEPFRRTANALEKAMRFTPRNPANGLVTIGDAALFRPYSFLDTVPLVGDQQFDSVLFWDACVKLAEMFAAAGQPNRAAAWRNETERVKKSLASLWNDKLGMFIAASEKWRQPSVWGSLFAVYAGIATPEQSSRITRWCLDNFHLIVHRGQVRHLPKGTFWGRLGPEFIER